MTFLEFSMKLRNPMVLVTGGPSTLQITFPSGDINWQFGEIVNLSASAGLVWTVGDNVMYEITGMKELIFDDITYYMIEEKNILFKEVVILT